MNLIDMKNIIAPSVLSADFAHLERDIKMLNDSECAWMHLDIMDGVFVPNLSFGFPVVESISLSNFLGRVNDSTIPIRRAVTGSPIKPRTVARVPVPNGAEGNEDTDFNTMRTRGITTGRKDFPAEGASLTFSTMSWSLSLGAGSI